MEPKSGAAVKIGAHDKLIVCLHIFILFVKLKHIVWRFDYIIIFFYTFSLFLYFIVNEH